MRKTLLLFVMTCASLLLHISPSQSQIITWNHADGSILVPEGSITLTSKIAPGNDEDEIKKMIHLDTDVLYGMGNSQLGGILGELGIANQKATLSVFSYDASANDFEGGKGQLLYKIFIDQSAATYASSVQKSIYHTLHFGQFISIVTTDQIKALGQQVLAYQSPAPTGSLVQCNETQTFFQTWLFNNGHTNLFHDKAWHDCQTYFERKQPVIVEVVLEGDAPKNIRKISVPGIGELDAVKYFQDPEVVLANKLDVEFVDFYDDGSTWATSFRLKNISNGELNVDDVSATVINIDNGEEVAFAHTDPIGFSLDAGEVKNYSDWGVIGENNYNSLAPAAYGIRLTYRIWSSVNEQYVHSKVIYFFRKTAPGQITTYQVDKVQYDAGNYAYALRGGMSAEYAVQKSLASLDGTVSPTWGVRTLTGGVPDLIGGGPISVYSSPDFLRQSIKKTVALYNDNLGALTPFNTVIISTGVPVAPYLSFYMKAPILPIQFLVASHSLAEVETMVDQGLRDGYSCFATSGYDPSIEGDGVSWIKLLKLPEEYADFILDHAVQNVILLGVDQLAFGESTAERLKTSVISTEDYAPGSIYVMKHGSIDLLRAGFNDFDKYYKEESREIADWESGIADIQFEEFRNSLDNLSPAPKTFTIKTADQVALYDLTMELALKFWKKNATVIGQAPVTGVAYNEYLIGYPNYESRKGQIPFQYWQAFVNLQVDRTLSVTKFKVADYFPDVDFNSLQFHVNAKYDRTALVNALTQANLSNVTMNTWQKADVFDMSDGMNAPCEVALIDIIDHLGGQSGMRAWTNSLQPLTIQDLTGMGRTASESHDLGLFPVPAITDRIKTLGDQNESITIDSYEWSPDEYWQIKDYPMKVRLADVTDGFPGIDHGGIEGLAGVGKERKQRVTISQFDLSSPTSDFDLKIGYKFNVTAEDGLDSYNPSLGSQQNMDCFEHVRVPKTSWLDIPSRVMAREGAILAFNGSVYDFDYNGIPGVVPFIKVDNVVKAQPQILSFKGEAVFAWDWSSKTVRILPRSKNIPSNYLATTLSTLFVNQTYYYPNVLAGMTYMSDGDPYDIEALQPQWMLDYPAFPAAYLATSGALLRCFLAGTAFGPTCQVFIENSGEAPIEEGWNDCSKLGNDENIKRYSTLAYRQYEGTFDEVPNSRTFVALKDNKLDIGIVDGDLGTAPYRYTKQWGMRNWELNNFFRWKGYDKLVNLDGGSSTQMWLNGRGPLHDWTGYPLDKDNQGPYYSRLVSTFVLLVPKRHVNQIGGYIDQPFNSGNYLRMDNTNISFDYNDVADHTKDKSFVDLSQNLKKIVSYDGVPEDYGMIGGNFKAENGMGSILFSISEDSYYPDTEGEATVLPEFRNLMVIGIGRMPEYLRSRLQQKNTRNQEDIEDFAQNLLLNNPGQLYYVKMQDNLIVDYLFEEWGWSAGWNSFTFSKMPGEGQSYNCAFMINGHLIGGGHFDPEVRNIFQVSEATHALIGAVNVDGRFITGNCRLDVDNFIFAVGEALPQSTIQQIHNELTTNLTLPDLPLYSQDNGIYAFQFQETEGAHSFAIDRTLLRLDKMTGLNLNTSRGLHNPPTIHPVGGETPPGGWRRRTVQTSEQEKGFGVYPNPATSEINIRLWSIDNTTAAIEMKDLVGKILLEEEYPLQKGSNIITLKKLNRSLPSGIYILSIKYNGIQRDERIVLK